MKYPKINTVFMRKYTKEECKVKKIRSNPIQIPTVSKLEFNFIKSWVIQEKIDGTNIRIFKNGEIRGRTDESSIPPKLLKHLQSIFTPEKIQAVFGDKDLMLFGEGYGAKIQRFGSQYLDHQSFILFDAYINAMWVNIDKIPGIAEAFGVRYAPYIPWNENLGLIEWEINDIIKFVQSKPKSLISQKELMIEGIVAKPYPILLFQNGDPLYWKLKCKDFE